MDVKRKLRLIIKKNVLPVTEPVRKQEPHQRPVRNVTEKEKFCIRSSPYLVRYRMSRFVRIVEELARSSGKNVRIAVEPVMLQNVRN